MKSNAILFISKLMAIILVSIKIQAQDLGIKFEQNAHWNSILEKAKTEKKYIFVDCYTSWCGPCRYMVNNIFLKEQVGLFYNQNFINVKLQFDSTSKDTDATKFNYEDAVLIKKKYKIGIFPTYLFFNSDGELMARDGGSCEENEFIKKGKNALDSNLQYYTQLKKYSIEKQNRNYLKNLALLALGAFDTASTAKFAKEYISCTPNILNSETDRQFIYETARTIYDTGFSLMMQNISKFKTTIDSGKLFSTLRTIIFQSEIAANYHKWKNWNKTEWDNYSKIISKKYSPFGEDVLFEIQSEVFRGNQNWEDYVNTIEKYRFKHILQNYQLNDFAWNIFKKCDNPQYLKKALIWSELTFKNQPKVDPNYMDTYANLLYKLGKKNEALEWEKKAQKIAIENGENKDWGQDVIDKIMKNEKSW